MKKPIVQFIIFTLGLALALPALAQVKDYRDIKFPKMPAFNVPEPETFTLDNGMKVYLLEDRELPLISVTARIATGSNYEPAGKAGLGSVFAQVQRDGGTVSRSGDEINEFLEARAAFVETGMSGDFGSASMNSLKDDFDDVLAIFIDVLKEPAFPEDKIELAKLQQNTNIARRNDNVGGITAREFQKLIYGEDSPLTQYPEYDTISAIDRDDLVQWHQKYYHPNNMLLGVVGDFDSKEMRKKLESAFADWERGPEVTLPEVPYNKTSKPGVYYIEKDDVTQANIRMGHIGINQKNPDYFAVRVMNEVFGGGFAARLFSNVRSKKGLAYSVGGGVGSSFVRDGVFQVQLQTKSGTMAEGVEALKEEVRSIIENPPTKSELELAKSAILQSFVFNYTSRAQILGQQLNYEYYGMPADYLETFQKNIEAVTQEEVAAAAKKYIHPDKLTLLVVGNEEDFDKPVSTFGEVTEIDISIPEPSSAKVELERNEDTLAKGRALMAKMSRKVGGADTSEISSLRRKMALTISMNGQQFGMTEITEGTLPDKMRTTIQSPMGQQVLVLTGDTGFIKIGDQARDMPAEVAANQRKGLRRQLMMLAMYANSIDAVAGMSSTINGESCTEVQVNFEGTKSMLCIADDGRVLSQTYRDQNPVTQAPGTIVELYSDYRDVQGLSIPFARSITFEGTPLAEMNVETFEVNPSLDAALFER